MKKINYYLGALALASLSLGACSSDKLAGEEPNGPDTSVERTVYVNIAIHGEGAGSRTSSSDGNPAEGENNLGDFDNGSEDEQKVNSVYLVFYDKVGNVVGNIVNFTPGADDFGPIADPNGTISNQMKKTVTITLQQGQDNPAQVMCYINPANPADLQNPLWTVQTITRDAVWMDGATANTKLFPMSNSVYYGDDGKVVMGAQINGNYYESLAAAAADLEKDKPEKAVDIYVERYAAKLIMTALPTDAIKDYVTYTTPDDIPGTAIDQTDGKITLKFNVDGWDVNGVAKNTYAVKSFRQASESGQIMNDNYSYDLMNKRINANTFTYENGTVTVGELMTDPWTWNNATYHRSYWACSPVYFQAEYPEVLSDYNAATSNQDFKSWNEIATNGKVYGTAYYFMETTSGIPALRSKNPNAAVPTICIVGHYDIYVGESTTPINPNTTNTTFYTYTANNVNQHPTVYFSVKPDNNTTAESAVDGTVSMHKRFLWQTTTLYHNIAAQGATENYVRLSAGNNDDLLRMVAATTIDRPSDAVLGTGVKLASYAQTLQLTNAALTATSGIYINDNGTPKAIVADNVTPGTRQITLTDANKILMQNVGYCHVYTQGAGKFSVPVKHLGWYRKGNEQRDATQIDMAKVRVGDLGLVRNHSYTVSITNISGLATGVAGKDNDIIPPADTKDVYAAYRINVLRWAVVPPQNVEL